MNYKNIFWISAIICTGSLYGQNSDVENIETLDEVVIIDSKFNLPRENSGKVVTKISAEELEKSRGQSLPEVINRVSGIEIGGTRGNEGQNLGYYVRGGRNRQVVILVDGIQVNDPSSIANDFDLRLLPLSQVASVEIIKGASSTLYGSGAGAAVISIQTKDPASDKLALHWESSVGTNQSQEDQEYAPAEVQNTVTIGGNLKKWEYQTRFSHRYSDNLSAVSPASEEEFEENPFKKYNASARVGYAFSDAFDFYIFGNYDKFSSSFDNYDFTDGNNKLHSDQLRLGSKWQYDYGRGSLVFNNSFNMLDREVEAEFPNTFDSRLLVLDAYNKYNFNNGIHALVGINAQFSNFNSYEVPYGGSELEQRIGEEEAHFEIVDPYLNLVYISDFGLNLNAGTRLNIHSNYGEHWVYNFNPSYNFMLKESSLKLLASYSTAFITPSLYQLFDPVYGNEDLEPEDNTTLEGGMEFNAEGFRASAVYFNRREKNYIDFVLTDPANYIYSYSNISEEFTADGIEVELSARILEQLAFSGNYTFTQTDEKFALRIPKHKANAGLDYAAGRTGISLKYQFNDHRTDSFFNETSMTTETVNLDSFGLLDLYASYQLTEKLQLFGGVYNLANTEYRELYGYTTRGRNARLGFSLRL